ncbi:hypothetical protein LUZ60_017735 [Juncus effusus]|nr:hypothetical protein LUZ60_017735 [Juncus effusus]
MAKAGIIEEFVTPVIKHLERAEKQIVNLKSGDDKIKKKFEEINKMIKDKKAILTKRKEWEGNIIEKFGVVEQHIDNILEDKECNINGALEHILTALKEMVEKETTTEEPGEDKAQIPKYERGESSKTSATELEDSSSGNKKWCRLSDISGLSKLRKLSINIGRGSNVDDEDSSSLKHLRNLKSLTMTWGLDLEENKPVDQEQESKTMVPENPPLEQQEKTPIIIAPVNIFPPENLEKLDLICFPNAESPQWMTPTGLNKLKRLYIRGGNLAIVSNNNNLQGAWKVEILRLRFLKNFKIGWNDLHGIFPEVECIELLECDKITDFPLTDQGFWFKAKQEASPGNNSADETFIQ